MDQLKDPAMLFYSADYLVGVIGMSWEDQGKYMYLLATMHQKGRLTEETIRLMIGSVSDSLKAKFRVDEKGLWYSVRLEREVAARSKFVNSRRANGAKGGRNGRKGGESSEPENHPIEPNSPPDGFATNEPTIQPNALPIGLPTDNLSINVIEIINVIEKTIENVQLKEKLTLLFSTKKWRNKNLSALNMVVKKCQTMEPEFVINQIENSIIGEWDGLFYERTPELYKKWLEEKGRKSSKKNKVNFDEINYDHDTTKA